MSFVSVDDLGGLVFATPRSTRKYRYLCERPEVSLFADDRRDRMDDLMLVTGVEVSGTARELSGRDREACRGLYLAKYPELSEFADAPDTALVRIEADRYDVVDHFQHLVVLETGPNSRR